MDKKEQTRLRVERYRDRQKALQDPEDVTLDVTPLGMTYSQYYLGLIRDGKLTISDDQRDRFPLIKLPFGPAYYKALEKQRGLAPLV